MFKKLKSKLRLKLRVFLGINDLLLKTNNLEESFIEYKNKNDKNIFNHSIELMWCNKQIDNHRKLISQFDSKVEAIHNTVESVVHIGTDVYPHPSNREHSWAVVCIEGKMNIVKFVDLVDRRNAMDILDFLKHFEAGRHCIDTPYSQMFYDGLWKF